MFLFYLFLYLFIEQYFFRRWMPWQKRGTWKVRPSSARNDSKLWGSWKNSSRNRLGTICKSISKSHFQGIELLKLIFRQEEKEKTQVSMPRELALESSSVGFFSVEHSCTVGCNSLFRKMYNSEQIDSAALEEGKGRREREQKAELSTYVFSCWWGERRGKGERVECSGGMKVERVLIDVLLHSDGCFALVCRCLMHAASFWPSQVTSSLRSH